MALTDYTGLKSSISDWLHRGDISASAGIVDDFIDMAEAEFNATLRCRSMEAQTDIGMSAGNISHPSDWLGWKRISILDSGIAEDAQPSPNEFLDIVGPSSEGRPYYYAVKGSKTYFNRTTSYTARTWYYQAIPALTTSNTTNWLLTKYPQAYLYGTLLQASGYIQDDPRIALWKQAYDEAMERVKEDSIKSLHGAQTPVMRSPRVF